jgi:RHS repeat-associated protein
MEIFYPFGMQMPGRTYSTGNYRYGFNGKEKDADMDGNNYDYGFRIYNPQIGRFLSVDPLTNKFAFYSPYHFAGNSPIAKLDLDGREPEDFKEKWEHKPLFDLRSQKRINENAFYVQDAKLGKVDPSIIYDQVKRQHFIVSQDDQGKNYYLKNDDGNNSVMTINPKTHEIKGGHFAEFETQNQTQARLTNELLDKAEAGIFLGAATVAALPILGAASATGTFVGKGVASAGYDVMAQLGTNGFKPSNINVSEVGLSFLLQDGGLTTKGIVKSFAKNAVSNLFELSANGEYKGIFSGKFSYSEAAIKTGIGTGFDMGVNLLKKIPAGKELTNRLLESQTGQLATGTAGASATNAVGGETGKDKK